MYIRDPSMYIRGGPGPGRQRVGRVALADDKLLFAQQEAMNTFEIRVGSHDIASRADPGRNRAAFALWRPERFYDGSAKGAVAQQPGPQETVAGTEEPHDVASWVDPQRLCRTGRSPRYVDGRERPFRAQKKSVLDGEATFKGETHDIASRVDRGRHRNVGPRHTDGAEFSSAQQETTLATAAVKVRAH